MLAMVCHVLAMAYMIQSHQLQGGLEWELVRVSVVSTLDTGFELSVTFTGGQKLLI